MAKRKYKKRALPLRTGELATKERQRQNGGVTTDVLDRDVDNQVVIKRHRALVECTLDAYFQRRCISSAQHVAGIRFRHAYLRAVLRVRVENVGAGSQTDPEMAVLIVIKSEKLLRDAYTVLSEAQKNVLISVCGHDEWAGGTYRIETMQRGLEKLVLHWKLA